MAGWMIDNADPARLEIAKRAMALGITGKPDKAAHPLGEITLANGAVVNAHVVHAVDPIITDGQYVAMINRMNEPGKGQPCLPGGFLDPKPEGGVETPVHAALREAEEEIGFKGKEGKVIGTRNMNRPFDVRVAQRDMPAYGIKEGDIFMVSTQAVRCDVPDLKTTKLVAGDDAVPGSARRVRIDSLTRESVGIADHFDMIKQALPEHFTQRADGKAWTNSLGNQNNKQVG